jgi:hypothetical protein
MNKHSTLFKMEHKFSQLQRYDLACWTLRGA